MVRRSPAGARAGRLLRIGFAGTPLVAKAREAEGVLEYKAQLVTKSLDLQITFLRRCISNHHVDSLRRTVDPPPLQ